MLGCACGEVGCRPLVCKVEVTDANVTWNGFRQPFRPKHSYSRFGPFVFATADYLIAVHELSAKISPEP